MDNDLLAVAEQEHIVVEYYDFRLPIKGIYFVEESLPPIIGLDNSLRDDAAYLRCVFAEEIGHHFTTIGQQIPCEFYHDADRMTISKAERKALKWAATYLIPKNELLYAFNMGLVHIWELAEYFNVTEMMVRFRFQLADLRAEIEQNLHKLYMEGSGMIG